MELQSLDFAPEFFEDEVRDGFFVSAIMKQYWAAQLKVLAEIDEICQKHNISWFIDSGTLLGSVRHGGFIPWDDDLDIVMLRPDYMRFMNLCRTELRADYCVLEAEFEEEHFLNFGRITNSRGISTIPSFMQENFGCPYAAGVDIFPLDGVPLNKEEEELQLQKLRILEKAAFMIQRKETETDAFDRILEDIERLCEVVLNRKEAILPQLMQLENKISIAVPVKEAQEVTLLAFRTSEPHYKFPKETFQDIIMMPFEGFSLPAPVGWEYVLKTYYGNWKKLVKSGGTHAYPGYKNLEDYLRKENGKNPFRYTLTKDAIPSSHDRRSFNDQCSELVNILKKAQVLAGTTASGGEMESARSLLEKCQSLAMDLGTRIEHRYERCEGVIGALERYCEQIYLLYERWENSGDEKLNDITCEVERELSELSHTKEILFLPVLGKWWESISEAYLGAIQDPNNQVHVIPLPYSRRYTDGSNSDITNDGALFPPNLPLVSSEEYSISEIHPDVIVIQDPFDGWSQWLGIPEAFYSRNLAQHTEKLVYIPCFEPDDPEDFGDRTSEALRYLIEQPAVVYADEVHLKSEKMRELYIKVLTELTGVDTKEYWQKKIKVSKRIV